MAPLATASPPRDQTDGIMTALVSTTSMNTSNSSDRSSSPLGDIDDYGKHKNHTSPACTPREADCPDVSVLKLGVEAPSTAVIDCCEKDASSMSPDSASPSANRSGSEGDLRTVPGAIGAAHTSSSIRSSSRDSGFSSNRNPLRGAAPPFVPLNTLPHSGGPAQLVEVRETSDRGKGLFATCDIPQGTRILCEASLLEIPFNELHYAWKCFCNLSSQAKATYNTLCDAAPSNIDFEKEVHLPGAGEDNLSTRDSQIKVMKIFSVNNFLLHNGHYGVFALASRMNHSCLPNVHFTSNSQLRKSTVHAARHIMAGEELLCNYIGSYVVYNTRAQRTEFLRMHYGFTCHCPACSDMTGFCDARREMLAGIMNGLNEFRHNPPRDTLDQDGDPFLPRSKQQALIQAQDAFNLLAEQGLYTMELWKAYHMGSELALECEEWEKAAAYAFYQYAVEQNLLGDEVDNLKKLGIASVQWIKHVQHHFIESPGKNKLSKKFWTEHKGCKDLWAKLAAEGRQERILAVKAHKSKKRSARKLGTKSAEKWE